MKENDSNSAVLHFNKALETDPKCVDALIAHGALSANQGHYKHTMEDFEGALQIDHLSICIYKEKCLPVCLFFMHLVRVRANLTKLSMALPYVQRKVARRLARPTG
jgi:lipopolysaccharide biosynthesis regulator YciM